MKIIGTLRDFIPSYDGGIVSFNVDSVRHAGLLKELEPNTLYSIEIHKAKSKRSNEQNRLMWKLLSEIDKKMNGERSNDEWSIYLMALERAGAKCEYVACLPKAEDLLKKQFRAVKLMNSFQHNGRTFNQYKVYHGSSQMDSKEMSVLIDTVLDMAWEVGVEDYTYYLEGLK